MDSLLLLGQNRHINILPILLLDQDLRLGVHLLVCLIVLLVLMQHNAMLISPLQHLSPRWSILLRFVTLLFLRCLLNVRILSYVISELIIKIFVHRWSIIKYFKIRDLIYLFM